jgi:hypothetical protein
MVIENGISFSWQGLWSLQNNNNNNNEIDYTKSYVEFKISLTFDMLYILYVWALRDDTYSWGKMLNTMPTLQPPKMIKFLNICIYINT